VWLTVDTATLKDRRNAYEYQVLVRLAEVLPTGVRVRIVADRGFGDQKLYRMLTEELKFDFVIRIRGNIKVTAADGEVRTAAEWVGAGGRARVLRGATVKGTYLRDKFHRLKARMGMKKAAMAVAHKILIAVFHMLQRGVGFADLGGGYLDRVNKHSTAKRLARRLTALGYDVMLRPTATA